MRHSKKSAQSGNLGMHRLGRPLESEPSYKRTLDGPCRLLGPEIREKSLLYLLRVHHNQNCELQRNRGSLIPSSPEMTRSNVVFLLALLIAQSHVLRKLLSESAMIEQLQIFTE